MFSNGPEQKKKKRKINNIVGQSGLPKQRGSFQTCEKKNNNLSDLGDNNNKVNVPMKCVFQFSLRV